jgi:Icc-related predicted phosphoesterase
MKFCVFGDLHGKSPKLPEADVYLITGDISGLPHEEEYEFKRIFRLEINSPLQQRISFLRSLDEKKHLERFISSAEEILKKFSETGKPVFYVSGNREVIFDMIATHLNPGVKTLEQRAREMKNVGKIDCEMVDIDGVRLLGIPFVPSNEWYIKNYEEIPGFRSKFEQLRRAPKMLMKVKADIVLSHCPPKGMVDVDYRSVNVGIESITEYIKENGPRYVFCGHIHEATGSHIYKKTVIVNMGTSYYVFEI